MVIIPFMVRALLLTTARASHRRPPSCRSLPVTTRSPVRELHLRSLIYTKNCTALGTCYCFLLDRTLISEEMTNDQPSSTSTCGPATDLCLNGVLERQECEFFKVPSSRARMTFLWLQLYEGSLKIYLQTRSTVKLWRWLKFTNWKRALV